MEKDISIQVNETAAMQRERRLRHRQEQRHSEEKIHNERDFLQKIFSAEGVPIHQAYPLEEESRRALAGLVSSLSATNAHQPIRHERYDGFIDNKAKPAYLNMTKQKRWWTLGIINIRLDNEPAQVVEGWDVRVGFTPGKQYRSVILTPDYTMLSKIIIDNSERDIDYPFNLSIPHEVVNTLGNAGVEWVEPEESTWQITDR